MTECVKCHKELPAPLDAYGDQTAPLCWTCFSTQTGEEEFFPGDEISDAHKELRDLERQISSVESDLDDLHTERRWLKIKIQNLEDQRRNSEKSGMQNWITAVTV